MAADCLEQAIVEIDEDARRDINNNEPDKAAKEIYRFIESGIQSIPLYNTLASAYFSQNNHDRAISCLKKALDIDPTAGFLYANLGTVYKDKGDLKKAINLYETALVWGINQEALLPDLISLCRIEGEDEKADHYFLVSEGLDEL